MNAVSFPQLANDALEIRRAFLKMHFEAKAGHLGSGLSDIDLLVYLHGAWLRDEDHFILSKGHAASSLYATLHYYGQLSDEQFGTYYKDGTLLPAHPAPRALPSIPAATGSLGHGLPIAAGLCYANKHLHQNARRTACLLSDGECDEGSVWEAALFAAHHELNNLTVIIDANGLQGFGPTESVLRLEPLRLKWGAFGFRTSEIDGHDFEQMHAALSELSDARPHCIIARTVKGKGVRFMENRLEWHYLPLSRQQYEDALVGLEEPDSLVDSYPMRVDFVKALSTLLRSDERGMLISGDLGFMAFEELAAALERRFVNAGIAEQNMMGVAAGAALSGLRPWVYSIAPFATYRCVEQIRNDICLHDLPVRIVGNGGGYTYGVMGSTHHALEDFAVLKALPNLQLFFPCANDHVAAAVESMAALDGPAYLRLAISAFSTDWKALAEQPETLTRHYAASAAPARLTIVGAGHGVQLALHALRHLGLDKADVDVFGVARFPWDFASDLALRASVERTRRLVFVEEHYGPGGMGESLLAALPPLRDFRLLSARYDKAQRYGSPRFHMQQCNLTPEALMAAVQDVLTPGAEA